MNMMMDEGEERIRASYRDNYPRLAQVKAHYDPDNLFRVNQNIKPATQYLTNTTRDNPSHRDGTADSRCHR